MATVLWHGFHSCSDQQKPEPPQTTVTALRLKLAPMKHDDLGGWRLLQSLAVKMDVVFIPRTSVKLSQKSLEMCTENLGCETGSDVITGGADIYTAFMASPNAVHSDGKSTTRKTRQQSLGNRKISSVDRSFPPPLTTMRGAERVLIRSRRKEGRIVMEAVKCPSSRSNFVADRSHGRLRLSLLRHEEDEGRKTEAESMERFQRLPATMSRCMEGEADHLHHRRHHHPTPELMNIRLCVATS